MSSDKISQLERDYKYRAEGESLFFKDKYQRPALRLEVPDLELEFTDGFYIRSDPKGTFYFNDNFSSLDIKSEPRAKYTVESIFYNRRACVNIKFYDLNSSSVPYAEQNVAANSGLVGQTNRTGNWKRQGYARSSAIVEKAAGSTTVTIRSTVIHKKGEFNADWSSFKNQTEKIKVHGTLYLKDTDVIDTAHLARWYSDHIVFYDNDNTGRDFSEFFFPVEYKVGPDETTLGSEHNKLFDGVKWSRV